MNAEEQRRGLPQKLEWVRLALRSWFQLEGGPSCVGKCTASLLVLLRFDAAPLPDNNTTT